MVCLTTTLVALTFALRGWGAWWLLFIIAALIPAVVVVAFTGIDNILPIEDFVDDVLLPLAVTVGIVSLVFGIFLGWIARKAARSFNR